MKKIIITSSLILILGLFSCKKETITSTSPEEIATGKPPSNPPPPTTSILQWQKTYGSSSNELGYVITKTSDGSGYVFVGSALGNGGDISGHHGGIGADAWVVKINNTGSIDWQKCLGGTKSDYAYDIITTTDGGYLFAGATGSNDGDITNNHGGNDLWVVKLDASGMITFQKTFGGTGDDGATSIIETADGGFLIAGYSSSNDGDILGTNHGAADVWVLKLNSSGNIEWQKLYGGSGGESSYPITIISSADGNYMVSATTNSTNGDVIGNHGGNDCWLFKINGNGDLLWQKTYGGSQNDYCNAVMKTADGSYIFSGGSSLGDAWIVKVDANGTIAWQKFYGGNDGDYAAIKDIDANGNIVLVGYTFSKNGDIPASKGGEDLWILRLDPSGNKLYSNVFGGRGGDMASDAVATADGGYITTGRSNSTNGDVSGNHGGEDVWVVKFKF
ncbi:MAG: T9SS C-terminal target domain-containing protein [Bacteroidetes bacterium]|nr:MAG: T9SS C-terminal target domain-containing protein [Bacteroidota bacterium]